MIVEHWGRAERVSTASGKPPVTGVGGNVVMSGRWWTMVGAMVCDIGEERT
jgi:hypothetical protein